MTKPTAEPEQLNMLDPGPSTQSVKPAVPNGSEAKAAPPPEAVRASAKTSRAKKPELESKPAPEAKQAEAKPKSVTPLATGTPSEGSVSASKSAAPPVSSKPAEEARFPSNSDLEPSDGEEDLDDDQIDAAIAARGPKEEDEEGPKDEEEERAPVAVQPAVERVPTLRPWQDICAGVVLAGAIGDAMGHPTKFIGSVESIKKKYGPDGVTRFELFWDRNGKRFAPYTDDTQMTEAVLRALLEGRREGRDLDGTMIDLAARFVEWSRHPQGGHRAPGNACLSGCRALESGTHWSKAGGTAAGGCGSVMRAYPFGLLFAHDLQKAEHWAVEHSRLTHRDPIALAACAAMAVGVARLARGEHPRTVSGEMVGAACRYSASTAAMMATAIDDARKGIGPEVTLDRLRAWAAHEAIAAAVYLIERHPDDPKAAILEGTNTPGDSDSIATLGGALLGARCGARSLPSDWVRDIERGDELLALALEI